jgi:hypothetical protein
VRKELLQTYGSMGMLDKAVFSRALNTNLPIEIARTLTDKRDRMCSKAAVGNALMPDGRFLWPHQSGQMRPYLD